ncbi:hypothetical protein ACQKMD_01985 [Viridibacillus sp. NPDC096237]|uniref:hypothetical protein n=1 Tax=Viridibacillus sp. NPDC096237 TaxID=3390721 RepID=UPI003CFE7C5B
MAYTSFSSIQMQQNQSINTQQPVALKQGQVFHGTIKQLFPDNQAEVQLGGHRFMAKLEVPMQAGNAHYFQVTGIEPDLQLKVVSGPINQTGTLTQQINQLLDSMQLPKTSEMQQIAAYFLKENVPMSKEQLTQAEQLVKQLPAGITMKDALQALQKIIDLKMPMQQDTFQALIQGGMKEGFTQTLDALRQLLQQDTSLSPAVREKLLQQLQLLAKPFETETGGAILAKIIQSLTDANASPTDKNILIQMLKEVGILPKNANIFNWTTNAMQGPSVSNFNSLGQLLQQIQMATPKEAVVLIQQLQTAITKNDNLTDTQKAELQQILTKFNAGQTSQQTLQTLVKDVQGQLGRMSQTHFTEPSTTQLLQNIQPGSQKDMPEFIAQLKGSIESQSLMSAPQKEALINTLANSTQQSMQVLVKELHGQLMKVFSQIAEQQPFKTDEQNITAKQHLMTLMNVANATDDMKLRELTQIASKSAEPFIQQLVSQAEQNVHNAIDSKALESAMKQTLQHLGLSYEAKLLNKTADIQQLAGQLKPQLLSLLQDPSASDTTKAVAEQIVARMNGMQYLSGENGPQHQIIMQIPLEFFGRKTDATLQWNGRMKDDGKIDADYARVLFYLQLNSLQETVIDMQVQSRVVTVTIYNEKNQLKELAEPLKNALKKGLLSHDYQLSGVFMKKFAENQPMKSTLTAKNSKDDNGGVDIRI